jgi:serine-type D-Ala-D-Ala carboxypeptidase/endopeptidase (penicillin-binding protein 4)
VISPAATLIRWACAAALAAPGAACAAAAAASAHTGPTPAPAAVSLAEMRHAVDSLVTLPEFRNALWGVLVVDLETGDTLYSRNAGKLFLPASTMKLVTTAVALSRLGAGYRYVTTLAARGPLRDGLLDGDLLVYGRGDPTVSDSMSGDAMAPLRDMADSLYDAGVRRIAGRLVVGADVFPGPTLGFGWSWDDLDASYGAPVDELLFNDGFSVLCVHAGAVPGDSVRVATSPAEHYPPVRIVARTVSAADTARLRTDRLRVATDTTSDMVDLVGTIAAGDSASLTVPLVRPDAAYLAALREALEARGITVAGAVTDSNAPIDTLGRLQSVPLVDMLPAILKPSQNQMAEMLLRTIGLVQTGVGVADSGARVEAEQLEAWGALRDGFVVRDGSGLSRYDYLSPETLVHVLDAMRRSPAFDAWYAALPVAGVDGTLERRMRGTAAAGNVHAKTGSLSNVRSLSGYASTRTGAPVAFSIVCNNFTASPSDVLAVEDSIAAFASSLRLR